MVSAPGALCNNGPVLTHQSDLAATSADSRIRWIRWALFLAWVTVLYNLLEGCLSLAFGWAERSVALVGFGVDSLVEVGTALLVIWRLRGEHGTRPTDQLQRERRGVRVAGILFLTLAAGMAVGSVAQLWRGVHPATTLPGMIIALISLAVMAALWFAKRRTVRALDSRTLASDLTCMEACMQLSGILLVGSLAYRVAPGLWWADAVAGLALAALIAREGVAMIRSSVRPDFQGGCGCH